MIILGESLHDLGTQVHSHSAYQRGRLDLVDPVHSAQLYQPADDASDARGPSLATSANVRFVQTGFGLAFEPAVIVVFQHIVSSVSRVYDVSFEIISACKSEGDGKSRFCRN